MMHSARLVQPSAARAAQWRALVAAAACAFGLLNPLLCLLACALATHSPTFDESGRAAQLYYCLFPSRYAALDTAAGDGLSRAPARSSLVPFGAAEGVSAHHQATTPFFLQSAWGITSAPQGAACHQSAPLDPPPRAAG